MVALQRAQVARTEIEIYQLVHHLATALGSRRPKSGTIKALHAHAVLIHRWGGPRDERERRKPGPPRERACRTSRSGDGECSTLNLTCHHRDALPHGLLLPLVFGAPHSPRTCTCTVPALSPADTAHAIHSSCVLLATLTLPPYLFVGAAPSPRGGRRRGRPHPTMLALPPCHRVGSEMVCVC